VKKNTKISDIYRKANRIYIIAILGVIVSLGTTAFDVFYKTGTINYILDGALFVFCAFFVYRMRTIKKREQNKNRK